MSRSTLVRAILWLAVLAATLASALLREPLPGLAAAALVLIALAAFGPRALLPALALVGAAAALAFAAGGAALAVVVMPALFAGLVGWLFARTLLPGRRPLIARAIAAIDGETWLEQSDVARYARGLTVVWTLVQGALLIVGLACVAHERGALASLPLPSPRLFAGAILPGAVAATFAIEFALRRHLLPQAPRHRFPVFLRRLVQAWPRLLD